MTLKEAFPEVAAPAEPEAPAPAAVGPVNDRVAQVLVKARELVEQGWVKGTEVVRWRRDGHIYHHYCMLGAVNRAVYSSGFSDDEAKKLKGKALRSLKYSIADTTDTALFGSKRSIRMLPSRLLIPAFNDSSEVRKKDVLRVFDHAIGVRSRKRWRHVRA